MANQYLKAKCLLRTLQRKAVELPWEYFMAQGGLFFPIWGKCWFLAQILCSLRCQPRVYLTSNAQQFFGQTTTNIISLNGGLISLYISLIHLNTDQISLNMDPIFLKKAQIPAQPIPGSNSNLSIHNHPSAANRAELARERQGAPEWSQNSRKPREPFPNAARLRADPTDPR